MKTRVVVYDFDQTLAYTPDRDSGAKLYLAATGKEWEHVGWWGRPETLIPPILPEVPSSEFWIGKTVEAYQKDVLDVNTYLVLMTGRPFKLRERIEELLHGNNLHFHAYYYRGMPGQNGQDTLEIKANIIKEQLIQPETEIFEIWEDRPDHCEAFLNLAKEWKTGKLQKIIIHFVAKDSIDYVY